MAVEVSAIADFYLDKNIFITGATGYVGKVLVEKLLRSCQGLRKIYILVREKRGKSPKERLNDYLNLPLFEKVGPGSLAKLELVEGDLRAPNLGISSECSALLTSRVDVVFHCAASVRFNESLKDALQLNVYATRSMLSLCRQMKNLKALVHVSTAFSNCVESYIREIVYPTNVPVNKMLDLASWVDPQVLEELVSRGVLGNHPNTYTYTKNLAENLVQSEVGGELPVAIVRPSIVTAVWKEPLPGFIASFTGANGIVLAGSTGMLRTMLCNGAMAAEIVPVDIVANLLVGAAWRLSVDRPNDVVVYNCTVESAHRQTWTQLMDCAMPHYFEYPHHKVLRYPGGTFKSSQLVNSVCVGVEHILPGVILDICSVLTFKKPEFLKKYKLIHCAVGFYEYFTTREWNFQRDGMRQLEAIMSKKDKEIFYLSTTELDWFEYWKNNIIFNRMYVFKEDISSLPSARRQLHRKYWMEQVAKTLAVAGFVFKLVQFARRR